MVWGRSGVKEIKRYSCIYLLNHFFLLLPLSQSRQHTRKPSYLCMAAKLLAWNSVWLGSDSTWPTTCVTLSKLLIFWLPHFHIQEAGTNTTATSEGGCKGFMTSGVLMHLPKCMAHTWSSHLRWNKGDLHSLPCGHTVLSEWVNMSLEAKRKWSPCHLCFTHSSPKSLLWHWRLIHSTRKPRAVCPSSSAAWEEVPCFSCQQCSPVFPCRRCSNHHQLVSLTSC